MRIFLYEHITATCDAGDPLYAEGAAMRDALSADLDAVAGVEIIEGDFNHCAAVADWTILIAPESDGILAEFADRVLECGGRLLGPSPDAIRLASDKLALCECWQGAGIPTTSSLPITIGLDGNGFGSGGAGAKSQLSSCWSPSLAFQANKSVIVKPRDGAGSSNTRLIRNAAEYDDFLERHLEGMIVQPSIPGTPASIAFLCGPEQFVPLAPTRQILSDDFHYLGGELLPSPLIKRAIELGRSALAAAGPGWLGYVGIDMVLGDDGDFAIEINPRLTSSYIGLRQATEVNLAEAMLRIAAGRPVPSIHWNSGSPAWRL